jgi:hypothetical protein
MEQKMQELIKIMLMECALDYDSAEHCDETIEDIANNVYDRHKEQLLLHNVSNSLDLVELERKIDEVLDNETSESLKEWLHSKRL